MFSKNPSLQPHVEELYAEAYETARVDALNETGLEDSAIPEQCPFPLQVCFPEFVSGL